MQSRAEHTGLATGQGGEKGRAAGRGDGTVGGRRRDGESRVFPLAFNDAHEGAHAPCVGDVRMRRIPVIAAHLPISAARKIAALKGIRLLLVELDEQIVGTVDDSVLGAAGDEAQSAQAMKPLDFCLRPAMSAAEARELFVRARATVLPVVAGGFVLGAVTRADVERAKAPANER